MTQSILLEVAGRTIQSWYYKGEVGNVVITSVPVSQSELKQIMAAFTECAPVVDTERAYD